MVSITASWRDSRKMPEPPGALADQGGVLGGPGDGLQIGDEAGGLGGRRRRAELAGVNSAANGSAAGVSGRQPARTASKIRWVICPAAAYRSGSSRSVASGRLVERRTSVNGIRPVKLTCGHRVGAGPLARRRGARCRAAAGREERVERTRRGRTGCRRRPSGSGRGIAASARRVGGVERRRRRRGTAGGDAPGLGASAASQTVDLRRGRAEGRRRAAAGPCPRSASVCRLRAV